MDKQHESQGLSPVVLKEQANSTIERLNDYCLLDIFAIKSIDLLDLCSIAATCTRFKQISQRIAPKEFNFKLLEDGMYELESGRNDNKTKGTYDPTDIERIFKNFGSSLSAVSFSKKLWTPDRQKKFNFLLKLVVKHCNHLLSLDIDHHTINSYYQIKMVSIYERLQVLKLEHVCMSYATAAQFTGLSSLIELSVQNVMESSVIMENVFPKLERFTFLDVHQTVEAIDDDANELSLSTLTTFISRHKMLKAISLALTCNGIICYKMIILQTISKSCKEELEELNIDIEIFPSEGTDMFLLQPIRTLKSLRKLTIWCEICYDFQFLSTLEELRELNFVWCILPKDTNQFCSLAQLTKLEIAGFHPSENFNGTQNIDVIGIISRLTNLENLNLEAPQPMGNYKCFHLKERELSKIVRIVKDRPKILTLKCMCAFKVENCKKNQHQLRLMPIE